MPGAKSCFKLSNLLQEPFLPLLSLLSFFVELLNLAALSEVVGFERAVFFLQLFQSLPLLVVPRPVVVLGDRQLQLCEHPV